MAAHVPSRGDIIRLQFDPASGHEMKGKHFGFVVSAKAFNARGITMVAGFARRRRGRANTRNCSVADGISLRTYGAGSQQLWYSGLPASSRVAKYQSRVDL
jgi:mRNA-degrading endonuclease toxin of MazEF toxin-antitoxin module